jgi:hypothetical protein
MEERLYKALVSKENHKFNKKLETTIEVGKLGSHSCSDYRSKITSEFFDDYYIKCINAMIITVDTFIKEKQDNYNNIDLNNPKSYDEMVSINSVINSCLDYVRLSKKNQHIQNYN